MGMMKPTGWWRVIAADRSLWLETSDEQEARDAVRPGDKLQQQYSWTAEEWRDQ